ncbi:hypothetical protein [Brevibacillus choshinensis]|nr:hypothetical protein [Brevibacillus choshinensis]MED4784248.1 hypothetical protein [Brevibacillus choshinensis]
MSEAKYSEMAALPIRADSVSAAIFLGKGTNDLISNHYSFMIES